MSKSLFREAIESEHQLLTNISFKSKKYWNYPNEYFEIWKNELTITPNYIRENTVFITEKNKVPAGYYSITHVKTDLNISGIIIEKGHWLEHMFILPEFIKQGIGSEMILHLHEFCNENNLSTIKVLSDPNAKGFYLKRAFKYITEYQSTIPGRTTPILEIQINS